MNSNSTTCPRNIKFYQKLYLSAMYVHMVVLEHDHICFCFIFIYIPSNYPICPMQKERAGLIMKQKK